MISMLISESNCWTDAQVSRKLQAPLLAIRQRSPGTMSSTHALHPFPPVLVRGDEAEHLEFIGHVLLADSSATGGALSSHRVALKPRCRWRGAASARQLLRAVLHPRRCVRPARPGRHRHCAYRRSASCPARFRARVRCAPRLDRRGADNRSLPASNGSTTSAMSSAAGRASSRPRCCSDCRTASTPTFSTVQFGSAPAPPLDAMTTGLPDRQYPMRPRRQSQAGFTSINAKRDGRRSRIEKGTLKWTLL